MSDGALILFVCAFVGAIYVFIAPDVQFSLPSVGLPSGPSLPRLNPANHPDHADVVANVKTFLEQRGVDVYTEHGSLMIAARVAWLLRGEGCGLHMKAAGSNIAPYHGEMVGISRVMYSDGQLYKILTDCPTTNGPEWADDGPYPTSNFRSVDIDPDNDPETA